MKKCPKCQQIYDETLSFCLQDGTALIISIEDSRLTETETQIGAKKFSNESQGQPIYVDFGENPTVSSSTPPPFQPQTPYAKPIPTKNPINFLLLAALFLALGIIGGGGLVLFMGGFSSNNPIVNTNRPENTQVRKTPEQKEANSVGEDDSNQDGSTEEDDSNQDDSTEDLESPTPQMEVCYLSDGGNGGGEVNVRRNCDTMDCTMNPSTKVRSYSNQTPLTKLGQSVRSGKFTWVKISIDGGVYWVSSTKIRCP